MDDAAKYVLRQAIASSLDYPSVYMGGPSQQSVRKAIKIVELLMREYDIVPKVGAMTDDAMLVRTWTVQLSAVGLDAYRGFYHQPRYGRPALALDMMEPFRPLVADSAVLLACNNGEIGTGDFLKRADAVALTPNGRKAMIAAYERRLDQEITHPLFGYRVSYRRLFEVQARLLGRYLAGEIPDLPHITPR